MNDLPESQGCIIRDIPNIFGNIYSGHNKKSDQSSSSRNTLRFEKKSNRQIFGSLK